MVPCGCPNRLFIEEIHPGDEEEFVSGFRLLRTDTSAQRFDVYQCPECGSLWCFEDNGRSNLAVRLRNKNDLDGFDMEEVFKTYMLEKSIVELGLSVKKCHWNGCYSRALNGQLFCPKHWYGFGDRQHGLGEG